MHTIILTTTKASYHCTHVHSFILLSVLLLWFEDVVLFSEDRCEHLLLTFLTFLTQKSRRNVVKISFTFHVKVKEIAFCQSKSWKILYAVCYQFDRRIFVIRFALSASWCQIFSRSRPAEFRIKAPLVIDKKSHFLWIKSQKIPRSVLLIFWIQSEAQSLFSFTQFYSFHKLLLFKHSFVCSNIEI